MIEGFTKKYNITKLVHYEVTDDIESAIAREKKIKGWLRSKKIALIESMNPNWDDLGKYLDSSASRRALGLRMTRGDGTACQGLRMTRDTAPRNDSGPFPSGKRSR